MFILLLGGAHHPNPTGSTSVGMFDKISQARDQGTQSLGLNIMFNLREPLKRSKTSNLLPKDNPLNYCVNSLDSKISEYHHKYFY